VTLGPSLEDGGWWMMMGIAIGWKLGEEEVLAIKVSKLLLEGSLSVNF
jgi:hypothetical protein